MGNLNCKCVGDNFRGLDVEIDELGKRKLKKQEALPTAEATQDILVIPFSGNFAGLPISQEVLSIANSLPPFDYHMDPPYVRD